MSRENIWSEVCVISNVLKLFKILGNKTRLAFLQLILLLNQEINKLYTWPMKNMILCDSRMNSKSFLTPLSPNITFKLYSMLDIQSSAHVHKLLLDYANLGGFALEHAIPRFIVLMQCPRNIIGDEIYSKRHYFSRLLCLFR